MSERGEGNVEENGEDGQDGADQLDHLGVCCLEFLGNNYLDLGGNLLGIAFLEN